MKMQEARRLIAPLTHFRRVLPGIAVRGPDRGPASHHTPVAVAALPNLGALVLECAEAFGGDVAFQIRRGLRLDRLTFEQAGERARRLAAWLTARGLVPGDRIVVWSLNMPEYAVLYFGAWMAGVVVVPIDLRTRADVLQRFVTAAGPCLGVKSRLLEDTFGPSVPETLTMEELFDLIDDVPPLDALPPISPDSLAEITFTSGTTGTPKGVLLTHGNFLAENAALRAVFPLQHGDRALSVLPLSHTFEQTINLLLAFTCGVRISYLQRTNAVTIARAMREERVTESAIVPELLRRMLVAIERRAQQQGQWDSWQRAQRVADYLPMPLRRLIFRDVHTALGGDLAFFGCGGAPLDLVIAHAWERMGVRIFDGYGLAETASCIVLNTPAARRAGTVGRPLPGVEVTTSAEGEILVRGACVTQGYLDNPELNARAFVDGWFRTGDIGFVDPDGFVHISGRDAFKIVLPNGQKVYPEDLEQVLNRHPLVKDSCVVGIARDGGEAVHAVLLTEAPARASEIIRATNRQLAAHQQIMGYTVWAEDDFPRTAIMKPNRALLRAAVQREQNRAPVPSTEATAVADPLVALIARVAGCAPEAVTDTAELSSDLKLDSVARIEVLAGIEEELGRVVDELAVGPETTVGELRRLVAAGASGSAGSARASWPRSRWARVLRPGLRWISFRLQDRWMRLEVVHPERAATLPLPSLLIFNYQGPYAPLVILRALPPSIRARVAIAVDARLWDGRERWQGLLLALGGQAFPFAKSGGDVRAGLEELGRWLDDGYAVIISPEGNPEVDGRLLPFLGGTGLIAVEMRVPMVPCKLDGYDRLFPPQPRFPYLPRCYGRVRLIIGEPLMVPKTLSYQEATARARRALIDTR